MNKKLNAFLRILTVLAAVTAVVFAFLLKGKIDTALTKTAWAVNDPELKAGKDYDARMASLATLPALLDGKRKAIAELELAKKDLQADVADKKMKIEALTATNTTLEGDRAELTRKRDELAAQLTDANSKKDGAEAALASAKEELVKATEKAASTVRYPARWTITPPPSALRATPSVSLPSLATPPLATPHLSLLPSMPLPTPS